MTASRLLLFLCGPTWFMVFYFGGKEAEPFLSDHHDSSCWGHSWVPKIQLPSGLSVGVSYSRKAFFGSPRQGDVSLTLCHFLGDRTFWKPW